MKLFLLVFVFLFLVLLGIGFWSMMESLYDPAPGPVIEAELHRAEFANYVFEIIIFPGRWLGSSAVFFGAAVWALCCSFLVVFFRRRRLNSRQIPRTSA
jgi:hypothetical protein